MVEEPVLQVRDLCAEFRTSRGPVRAVDGVSFDLHRGESLGIVGESGSGKSATCLSLMRLLPEPAGRIVDGSIVLNGRDIVPLSERAMRSVRGREITMITQDPMTSLDPLFTVGDQVREALPRNRRNTDRVAELLQVVRIPDAARRVNDYPHQMSGGMRQRVVAAISIATEAGILIADEPTTALDVTIQLQFLELLRTIQRDRGLALILVTHDLSIVSRLCDRTAVMYAGEIVEMAATSEIFRTPKHPYTQGLLRSLPRLGQFDERLATIEGQPPDLAELSAGCRFHPRCPEVMDICRHSRPGRFDLEGGRMASCWLMRESGSGQAAATDGTPDP